MKKIVPIIIVVLAICLSACTKTEYVTVEKVKIDTTYITKHQRDSIYLHDSTFIKEKGDTLLIEKWHTKYIEKEVHDTCYQSKVDSIPVPYPVEKEVPAQLSWWQKTRIYLANILLLGVVCYAAVWFIRKKYF